MKRIRGEDETKVIRDIAQLIVPSAEILADTGAKRLEILRETTNAYWVNTIPFIRPPGSRPAPRPQPDFGLGFKRDAFSREQLQSYNLISVTPLLIPQRSQSICYVTWFDYALSPCRPGERTAREINGFSISHSDADVRIYGHYAVVKGRDIKFYRHSVAEFSISPTAEGDQRWKAYTFVRNVYDLWIPEHFNQICSAIEMLPADLNCETFNQSEIQFPDQELASLRSGLSQQFDNHSLADEGLIPRSEETTQQIMPDTTIQSQPSSLKKKKK
ncbi:hypothetical protein AJ78_02546 [Emergomyces pasteurianus Ep9510]|uniref:DUF7924 domain-containing protein n=1 Tax=Emergomyces pasteurianus Ep9510 TaxID=1447872 RepID=A0A1J9PLQ3_9EURO|nr:hypothetical protein AJ78_02546 [Emergomyces pasteurianus Ep9510]